MDNRQVPSVDLETLAYLMAKALEGLDCPECCGPVHHFIEHGAVVYGEEREWACFAMVVRARCAAGQSKGVSDS